MVFISSQGKFVCVFKTKMSNIGMLADGMWKLNLSRGYFCDISIMNKRPLRFPVNDFCYYSVPKRVLTYSGCRGYGHFRSLLVNLVMFVLS